MAFALGVEGANIIIEPEPKDTREESLRIRDLVNTNQFVLVTSATHMPRSLALFGKPRDAPDRRAHRKFGGKERFLAPGSIFPSGGNLR